LGYNALFDFDKSIEEKFYEEMEEIR